MNEHDFELLVESIKQAGEIKRESASPAVSSSSVPRT